MPIDVLRGVVLPGAGRRAVWRAAVRWGRIRIWLGIKKLIKEILIQAGSIEWIATPPMRQREPGRRADVRFGDLAAAVPCGMGSRRSCGHDVCPHAVDLECATHPRDSRQLPIAQAYRGQQCLRPGNPGAQLLFVGCVGGNEIRRVAVEGHPPADDLGS